MSQPVIIGNATLHVGAVEKLRKLADAWRGIAVGARMDGEFDRAQIRRDCARELDRLADELEAHQ